MAFPAAEAAVQVAGFTGVGLQGTTDKRQRIIETLFQLGCDDVFTQRLLGTVHILGEMQDEVATLHAIRDVDEIFDKCHFCQPSTEVSKPTYAAFLTRGVFRSGTMRISTRLFNAAAIRWSI